MEADAMFAMADCTRAKYNYSDGSNCKTFFTNAPTSSNASATTNSRRGLARRQRQSNVLTTDMGADVQYTGQVSFGNSPQTFDIVLDTGSSDLWVQTTQCTNCRPGTGMFNTAQSSSFEGSSQSLNFTYSIGNAVGTFARDTVSFGGFSVDEQVFGTVTQVFNGVIPTNAAGILGLAFQPLAKTLSQPFWLALQNANQLTNPEFSFFLARNADARAAASPGGALTLGGRNETLFTGAVDFQDFPSGVTPSFWWQEIASFTLNDDDITFANGLAAIDTGTTLLGGPQDAVANFWGAVPGAQDMGSGMWSYPCNASLDVTISFGGPAFPMNPADLNFGQLGGTSDMCMGSLFSMGTPGRGQPAWIIGDVFLKNVYTVFRNSDPPAVGFAQLSDAAGGSSGTPGPAPTGRAGGSRSNGAQAVGPPALVAVFVVVLCVVTL